MPKRFAPNPYSWPLTRLMIPTIPTVYPMFCSFPFLKDDPEETHTKGLPLHHPQHPLTHFCVDHHHHHHHHLTCLLRPHPANISSSWFVTRWPCEYTATSLQIYPTGHTAWVCAGCQFCRQAGPAAWCSQDGVMCWIANLPWCLRNLQNAKVICSSMPKLFLHSDLGNICSPLQWMTNEQVNKNEE